MVGVLAAVRRAAVVPALHPLPQRDTRSVNELRHRGILVRDPALLPRKVRALPLPLPSLPFAAPSLFHHFLKPPAGWIFSPSSFAFPWTGNRSLSTAITMLSSSWMNR
eukprot:752194-Hanusia_phi.AAC.4